MNGHTGGTAAAHTHTRSCRPPLCVWVRAMRARTCAVLRAACCVLRLACTSFTQVHCRRSAREPSLLEASKNQQSYESLSLSLSADATRLPALPFPGSPLQHFSGHVPSPSPSPSPSVRRDAEKVPPEGQWLVSGELPCQGIKKKNHHGARLALWELGAKQA